MPPPLYWDSRNRTNKRAAIVVVATVLTAMSFPVQAQTINICDRTPQVRGNILSNDEVTADSCASVSSSEMAKVTGINLRRAGITSLQSGDFANLPGLTNLRFQQNNLDTLPAGIFSGLTRLNFLELRDNPGSPFRLTVKFEPEELETDFTTAEVKLVLREGAPRRITVSLSATGATLSTDSLRINTGGTQSAAVTVTRAGSGYFKLAQENLQLGGSYNNYKGFRIVQGSPITIGILIRARVFLERALE